MKECTECGMEFMSDEMTRYRGAAVCFDCYEMLAEDEDDENDFDDEDFDDDDDDEDDDFDDED